jgi:hypothetical protein
MGYLNVLSVGACSSARLERTPDKREVGGSSPPRPIAASLDPAWLYALWGLLRWAGVKSTVAESVAGAASAEAYRASGSSAPSTSGAPGIGRIPAAEPAHG